MKSKYSCKKNVVHLIVFAILSFIISPVIASPASHSLISPHSQSAYTTPIIDSDHKAINETDDNKKVVSNAVLNSSTHLQHQASNKAAHKKSTPQNLGDSSTQVASPTYSTVPQPKMHLNLPQQGALSIAPIDGSVHYHQTLGYFGGPGFRRALTLSYDSDDTNDLNALGRGWRYNLPTIVCTNTAQFMHNLNASMANIVPYDSANTNTVPTICVLQYNGQDYNFYPILQQITVTGEAGSYSATISPQWFGGPPLGETLPFMLTGVYNQSLASSTYTLHIRKGQDAGDYTLTTKILPQIHEIYAYAIDSTLCSALPANNNFNNTGAQVLLPTYNFCPEPIGGMSTISELNERTQYRYIYQVTKWRSASSVNVGFNVSYSVFHRNADSAHGTNSNAGIYYDYNMPLINKISVLMPNSQTDNPILQTAVTFNTVSQAPQNVTVAGGPATESNITTITFALTHRQSLLKSYQLANTLQHPLSDYILHSIEDEDLSNGQSYETQLNYRPVATLPLPLMPTDLVGGTALQIDGSVGSYGWAGVQAQISHGSTGFSTKSLLAAYGTGTTLLTKVMFPTGETQHIEWLESQVSVTTGGTANYTVNGVPACVYDGGLSGNNLATSYAFKADTGDDGEWFAPMCGGNYKGTQAPKGGTTTNYAFAGMVSRPYAKSIDTQYLDDNSAPSLKGSVTSPLESRSVTYIPNSSSTSNNVNTSTVSGIASYTGFPMIGSNTSSANKQTQNLSLLWRLHDMLPLYYSSVLHTDSYQNYNFSLGTTNRYTDNMLTSNYNDVGLSTGSVVTEPNGTVLHKTFSYANYIPTTGNSKSYPSIITSNEQSTLYNRPTTLQNIISNPNTFPGKTLRTQQTMRYTAYGDPRLVCSEGKGCKVYYYSYDAGFEGASAKYHFMTLAINLPNTTQGQMTSDDMSSAGSFTAHPPVATFVYTMPYDKNITNLKGKTVSGYIACSNQTSASGSTASPPCFTLATLGLSTSTNVIPGNVQSVALTTVSPIVARIKGLINKTVTPGANDKLIQSVVPVYNQYGQPTTITTTMDPLSSTAVAAKVIHNTYTYGTNAMTVITRVTTTGYTDANNQANQWQADPYDHATKKEITYTGQVLTQWYNGAATSGATTFDHSISYAYDAFGRLLQKVDHNYPSSVQYGYNIGSNNNSQITSSEYCANGFAPSSNTSAIGTLYDCQDPHNLIQSKAIYDNLGRLTSKTLLHQAGAINGGSPSVINATTYTYDDNVGDLLQSQHNFGPNNTLLSTAWPIYDANHDKIGVLSKRQPVSASTVGEKGVAPASTYPVYGLTLNLSDVLHNRHIAVTYHTKGNVTTLSDALSDMQANYIQVKQGALGFEVKTTTTDGGASLSYIPFKRLSSQTSYYVNSQIATLFPPLLNQINKITGSNPGAVVLTNYLSPALQSLNSAIHAATPTQTQQLQTGALSAVKQTRYFYNIYGELTTRQTLEGNKQTVVVNAYNDLGQQISQTTSLTGNLADNSGDKNKPFSSTSSSGVWYPGRVNTITGTNQVLGTTYYQYNDLGKLTSTVKVSDPAPGETGSDYLGKSLIYDALGKVRAQWVCSGSNYQSGTSCLQSKPADLHEIKSHITYDGKNRILSYEKLSGAVQHRAYTTQNQLAATWLTKDGQVVYTPGNMNNDNPICYVYNRDAESLYSIYFNPTGTLASYPNVGSPTPCQVAPYVGQGVALATKYLQYTYTDDNFAQLASIGYDNDKQRISYRYDKKTRLPISRTDITGKQVDYQYASNDGKYLAGVSIPFAGGYKAYVDTAVIAGGGLSTDFGTTFPTLSIDNGLSGQGSHEVSVSKSAQGVDTTSNWTFAAIGKPAPIIAFERSWNYLGQLVKSVRTTDGISETNAYQYDLLHRVTQQSPSITAANKQLANYSYRIDGSVLDSTQDGQSKTYTKNSLGQILGTDYAYDGDGNMTMMPNPNGSGMLCLKYNANDQLISAFTSQSGNCSVMTGTIYHYQYYPTGQRSAKIAKTPTDTKQLRYYPGVKKTLVNIVSTDSTAPLKEQIVHNLTVSSIGVRYTTDGKGEVLAGKSKRKLDFLVYGLPGLFGSVADAGKQFATYAPSGKLINYAASQSSSSNADFDLSNTPVVSTTGGRLDVDTGLSLHNNNLLSSSIFIYVNSTNKGSTATPVWPVIPFVGAPLGVLGIGYGITKLVNGFSKPQNIIENRDNSSIEDALSSSNLSDDKNLNNFVDNLELRSDDKILNESISPAFDENASFSGYPPDVVGEKIIYSSKEGASMVDETTDDIAAADTNVYSYDDLVKLNKIIDYLYKEPIESSDFEAKIRNYYEISLTRTKKIADKPEWAYNFSADELENALKARSQAISMHISEESFSEFTSKESEMIKSKMNVINDVGEGMLEEAGLAG